MSFGARLVSWLRRYGRWLLLVLGVGAVVGLVQSVGASALWAVLVQAGPVLFAVIALDLVWMACEGTALLLFYGPTRERIPARAWLRACVTHYATMVVLPVGRIGAEIARAAMMAPHVGNHRAAAGAAQMQIMVMLANAVVCVPCLWAATRVGGWSGGLAALIGFNLLGNAVMGLGLLLVTRKVRIGGWLGGKFSQMVHWGPEVDTVLREGPALPVVPLLLCAGGRAVQAVECGLVLAAVGGAFTLDGSLIAEGIRLASAAIGDMVPNQVGVSEGMHRLFAEALRLGDHPERALAIPLVMRVANFLAAGSCFLALQLWPAAPAATPAVEPAGGD